MAVRLALAWSYGAQAFIFAITFSASVIVARILGPYEMGIYAVAAATAGAMAVMSAFSVGTYLVRHPDPDQTLRTTAFTVNVVLNVLVSAAILVVVALGARFGMLYEVRQVLILLAIAPLIAIFEFLPSSFMQRDMQFKRISLISMGRSTVNSAVLLSLAWSGWGYLSIAFATLASATFTATMFSIFGRQHASLRLGLKGWRDLTRFGMQMMSIGGLAALVQRLSELVLGHFLGLAALGIYSRASSLANQIWENVYGLSTRVIFAQMAKELREANTLRQTYTRGLALLTAVIGPLFVSLAILSGPVVHVLYGDRWAAAALPLSILMLSLVLALGYTLNWELCVLRHRTGWQARVEGVRAAVGLLAFSIGASLSVATAAVGRMVEVLCGFALYGPKMGEMAGTEPGEIYSIYRQSAALTIGAVAPLLSLMAMTGWSPRTSWSLILPAGAAGLLIWLFLLRTFRHPLLDELKRLGQHAVGMVARHRS